MKIKHKVYGLCAALIIGLLTLFMVDSYFEKTTNELVHAEHLTSILQIDLLQLRRDEKDFLLRMNDKYLDDFNLVMADFTSKTDELFAITDHHGIEADLTLKQDIVAYHQGFIKLVEAYRVLGFSDELGLRAEYQRQRGKLIASGVDAETLVTVDRVVATGNRAESSEQFLGSLGFVEATNAMITQREIIGRTYKEGMLGETRALAHKVEEHFEVFSHYMRQSVEDRRNQLALFSKLFLFGFGVMIISCIVWISTTINRQLSSLIAAIKQITESNNVSLRASVSGHDELSTLANYFNQLLDNLESLIAGTQQRSTVLSSNTHSMQSSLDDTLGNFEAQSSLTSTMTTSVRELVATINEISESTAVAASGVQKATTNAELGREVVKSTVENVDVLSSTLHQSETSISSLNGYVDQIGDAVTMIQGIAEQTNLLALNAAIEAARAGEQGRGFAVVADEVRALASRTHQSTEEITKVVNAITQQMSDVINHISQCNEQGEETRKASQALDNSLSGIISDMHNIQTNSERIAAAIEQQGAVMGDVDRSIQELNQIAEQSTQSAEICLTQVADVSEQASKMDQAAARFITHHSR